MYNLDTNAAKQADQKSGAINEAGKYIGTFTRAENITSTKGTHGVEFSFKSDAGLGADYLTLWTKNKDGKELYGYKTLMAIMACLKVRHVTKSERMVEKYDHASKTKTQVHAEVFPELMGKPIGLLITMEEYEKGSGGTAWKPTIYAPFEAGTELTASEILTKAQRPEMMQKMMLTMSNRPLRNKPAASAPQNFDDFDDDIPF
jgi:hypothetical protein